jgi:cell division protein FtsN
METSGSQMDDQSTVEPSTVQPEHEADQPALQPVYEPASDWDLRALDVTAGEPD